MEELKEQRFKTKEEAEKWLLYGSPRLDRIEVDLLFNSYYETGVDSWGEYENGENVFVGLINRASEEYDETGKLDFLDGLLTTVHEEYYQYIVKNESATARFQEFNETVERNKRAGNIKTDFDCLDRILGGGLRAGLYTIGAISSLGKTTFILQMADQLAENGHDVLYFSLEMASAELIAKSISRIMYGYALNAEIDTKNAKTTIEILNGNDHKNKTQKELHETAVDIYKDFAEHIFFKEGIGNVSVLPDSKHLDTGENKISIVTEVKKHTEMGKKPIVFIDYLQLLAPANERLSDKQNVDRNVLELKRLSRDEDIPIIVISSLNRENYSDEIGMSAFKESGAIEYSSDVLIGLQYEGIEKDIEESDQKKKQRIKKTIKEEKVKKERSVQLKVLKNRNGITDDVKMKFIPAYNIYTECDRQD